MAITNRLIENAKVKSSRGYQAYFKNKENDILIFHLLKGFWLETLNDTRPEYLKEMSKNKLFKLAAKYYVLLGQRLSKPVQNPLRGYYNFYL